MHRNTFAVAATLAVPFIMLGSVAFAQASGPGSENRGEASIEGLPRGVADFEASADPQPRALPSFDSEEIDRAIESFTRKVLDEDGMRALHGTVRRSADGTVTESVAPADFMERVNRGIAPFGPDDSEGEGESADAGEITPRAVTPTTARQIRDGSEWPFRAVGQIIMLDENGFDIGHCTGTLIGPNTVLTAAHCLYDQDGGGWVPDLRFLPGQTTNVFETGPTIGVFDWEDMVIHSGWISEYDGHISSTLAYDIAVIWLQQPVPGDDRGLGDFLGWMQFAEVPRGYPGYNSNLLGYPGDRSYGSMWLMGCPVRFENAPPQWVRRDCTTAGGTSGGPMYLYLTEGDQRLILGISVAGNDVSSISVTIDAEHFAWLEYNWY